MSATVWLTLLSALAVAALFIALAVFLTLIIRELSATGGTATSNLAKIRMGLRAIEVETGHLPVEATKLNAGLAGIRDGLAAVDGNIGRLGASVTRQEAGQ